MLKRFTVTMDVADYARLRALAYADEVQVAVKARDLIVSHLAEGSRADLLVPAKDDGDG
jgi:hypothetical protein